MSSTAPERAQQEPSTTTRQDEAVPARLIPAKRERDDDSDVQFISSQPVKKMRLGGDETGPGGQTAETPAACPNGDSGQVQTQPDSTIPDRSTSAMPLGLPSHLPPLDNRGASLPVIENFSFETAHTASLARPPTSVAVSPRQIPQPTTSGTIHVAQPHAGQGLSSQGMSLGHIAGSGALESGYNASADPATNEDNPSHMNTTSNIGLAKKMDVGATPTGPSNMSHTMSSFTVSDSFPMARMTPSFGQSQHGTAVPNGQTSMASIMPSMPIHVSPQQHQASSLIATTLPGVTPTPDRTSRQLPQGQASRVGALPSTSTWGWSSPEWQFPLLQHPRPVRPPHVSGLLSGSGSASPLPMQQQRRPCLACDVARQYGMEPRCHTPAQGQVRGAPFQESQAPYMPQPTSWAGGFGSQTQALPSLHSGATGHTMASSTQGRTEAGSFPSPTYACPPVTTTNQGATNYQQARTLPVLGPAPLAVPGVASAAGQNHFSTGTDRNTTQYAFNPMILSPLSILPPALNAHTHGYSHSRPGFPTPPSTNMQHPQRTSTTSINVSNTAQQAALKPPQQQPQPQGSVHTQHHRPPPTQQLQPQPPPHAASAAQRASAISSAATRAATHASTRSKHAQNLLVDVAELVAEIFPFDIVARQHGTLPRKVSEALAAVVQVPLLRCATDKRRAGKLGSDRMKDFREARRGWLALVREWEREERERERGGEEDAEGEDDDGVVVGGNDDAVRVGAGQGYGNAGDGRGNGRRQSTTKGKGGKQANVDPRAVYPPGEPSALDVALLLPPAEMPDQMLREGFFSGPW